MNDPAISFVIGILVGLILGLLYARFIERHKI